MWVPGSKVMIFAVLWQFLTVYELFVLTQSVFNLRAKNFFLNKTKYKMDPRIYFLMKTKYDCTKNRITGAYFLIDPLIIRFENL